MRAIAGVIIASNPDIVNLVEVENIEALTTFNEKFLANRGYRPYLVKGKDTYTGEDLGLLTRIDPLSMARDDRLGTSGATTKGCSKNYYAKFAVGDLRVALIGLHLLARPNASSRREPREAQAQVIRQRAIDLEAEGFELLVMGDFNDYDGDPKASDHIDSIPITNVLRDIRAMLLGDADDNLVNAAERLPKGQRYTAFWDKDDDEWVDYPEELTSIDHILVSPKLSELIEHVAVPHDHDPRKVSDHYPVVVRLRLAPAVPVGVVAPFRLVALLPNPTGDENQNESVTIRNTSAQKQSLAGWTLRDLVGRIWALPDLDVDAGDEVVIMRNGRSMAMNNNGDTIDLIEATGAVVQTVTFGPVAEGELVHPN